jgi:hypothetical protein
VAAGLAALLFVTYGYFVAAPSWNENSRFALTRSLVERQRIDIDPYHHETGDRSAHDGHHYSDKAPGASFLAIPAYAAYHGLLRATGAPTPASMPASGPQPKEGRILVNASFRRALYVCNLFTNALAGALLGAAFFLALCRRLAVPPRAALACTAALAAGTLVLPYATMFYGHVLAGAFLFGAFCLLDPARPSARRLAGAGGLAGLAVLTELPTAPAALALGGYALWQFRPRRPLVWFAAGATAPLVLLGLYQLAAFGAPWRSGYAQVSDPIFAAGMSQGVMGVGWPRPGVMVQQLVGRARGLLYTAPVLVLALGGLVRLVRRRRPEGVLAAVVVAYFLLMNAGYYMWWGGSALGPRHLIPALPFLCLGLPFAFARPRPVVLGVLLAVSVANMLAATAVEPSAPMVTDVLVEWVYRHLLAGEVPLVPGASNLGAVFRLRGPASLLPLLLLWGVALRSLLPLVPPERGAGPA